MLRLIILFIFLNNVFAQEEEKTRLVYTSDGGVIGTKYWDGDFYEFFSVPYAEAPTGRDRFQAPLPVKPWKEPFPAKDKNVVCHQSYFTDEDDDFILNGDDDCLVMNLFVPEIASEDNLLPVIVYVHSGAFSGGNGNMARFHFLARHDLVVISFNYRLGAIGFACLGNKEIPGNAGLKDQVAALKWIKKNVSKFGGDPNRVTLAGFSVGASMAELLALSKTTDGLIHQLILESGSALSPFGINRDPIATAKNLAYAMGYNGTGSLKDLTEYYLEASVEDLTAKSLNFFLPNSTFGFSPCVENVHEGIQPFLTESPYDILKKGQAKKIPMIIGFANMEGISRTIKFGEWRERMTEDFTEFLPADLAFDSEKSRQDCIKVVKERYFKGNEVTHDKIQGYVDYFSDAMFKYSIMRSLRLHAASSRSPIYVFEFSFVGKLNMEHNYMDRIKGAGHRDQTAYMLDFYGWTNSYRDLDMRDRLTTMWTDFAKYGDPTEYESSIINYKWLPYTNQNQYYLQIGKKQTMKKNLALDAYSFWDKIYEKYFWNPTAPIPPKEEIIENKQDNGEKLNVKNNEKSNVANKGKEEKINAKQEPIKEKKVVKETKQQENIADQKYEQDKKVVKEVKKEEQNKIKQDSVKVVEPVKRKPEEEKIIVKNVVDEVKKEDKKAKQELPKVNKVVDDVKKDQKINEEAVKVTKDSKVDKKDTSKENKSDNVKDQEKKK